MPGLYQDSSTIAGPLHQNKAVSFKPSLERGDRLKLVAFMMVVLATSVSFVWYLLHTIVFSGFSLLVVLSVALIVLLELIRVLQSLTLFLFAYVAKDPLPMVPQYGLRVAVLTTIVPSKEPFSLVLHTLQEMKKIETTPGSKVHVWLLDEGNDPAIRARCDAIGVRYFSRGGLQGWNTGAGMFRARTKHGNHNAWRRAHEHDYDVVAQMDPDHVPQPDFLTRTLGYFADPDVAFVVAPQVYGNLERSWIARAAAFQAYVFHGVIQRGGNGMQAPLLIGTNHLYRTAAFRQINGYQDSIIEDHLTSMVMFGATSSSGRPWKGVYTPDIIAIGEGPTSFTDYFNQQKRWAYGIWDIAAKSTRDCIRKMTKPQATTFLMLQFFYPSVALAWLLSSMATLLFSFAMPAYQNVASVVVILWLYSIASSLALFFWLRKFNLVEHERRSWGLGGMALLLMCIPVYVSAALQAIARRPLTYAVTAKGSLTSPDTLRTFLPHMGWLAFNGLGLALVLMFGRNLAGANTLWIVEHMAICAAPIAMYGAYRFTASLRSATRALPQLRRVMVAHNVGEELRNIS